jgi:hypothetical protein
LGAIQNALRERALSKDLSSHADYLRAIVDDMTKAIKSKATMKEVLKLTDSKASKEDFEASLVKV